MSTGASLFAAFVQSQRRLSRRFDTLLPNALSIDGNHYFQTQFVPGLLAGKSGLVIYDVGGGKHPHLSLERKSALNAVVVGLDIDQRELDAAPPGCYDSTVCTDIARYKGAQDADVVICQTLMEHVQDVPAAFKALASMLKPDGQLLLFVPSRNAAFARLNLLLPEGLKRRILYAVFPDTRKGQGFRSFYDHCTPAQFNRLAEENYLAVQEFKPFYCSMYFSFCTPLHMLWRLWILVFRAFAPTAAAETFAMAWTKRGTTPT